MLNNYQKAELFTCCFCFRYWRGSHPTEKCSHSTHTELEYMWMIPHATLRMSVQHIFQQLLVTLVTQLRRITDYTCSMPFRSCCPPQLQNLLCL
jgi:hypothetical protein